MNNSNGSQQTEPLGNTSLLLSCASNGDVPGIIQLLDKGASVNSCDYDKRTGLHVAASEGQVAVVELLLSRGANVNPVDRWGDTVSSSIGLRIIIRRYVLTVSHYCSTIVQLFNRDSCLRIGYRRIGEIF